MKTRVTLLALLMPLATAHAQTCQNANGPTAPTVVELFTSEGCSSCPPADRWLSTLKGRSDVLALGFHVDYWDRLGWPDRFALPEATARQSELARIARRQQVYTPQVVAAGRDWQGWPQLPAPSASPLALSLQREGEKVTVRVPPVSDGAQRQLSGFWAVLEDNHTSSVRSGENAGETLRHDHVVRLYRPVPAWSAAAGLQAELTVSRGVPQHPRRVVFVVTDLNQRPLQALALAC